jgi:hypothetical protein
VPYARRNPAARDKPHSKPYQVRLPGFIPDEAVGLGDVLQRVTYTMSVKPCGGCERRAAAMKKWMVLHADTGWRKFHARM